MAIPTVAGTNYYTETFQTLKWLCMLCWPIQKTTIQTKTLILCSIVIAIEQNIILQIDMLET